MGTNNPLSFLSEKDKAAIAMRKLGVMVRERELANRRKFAEWKRKSPEERLGKSKQAKIEHDPKHDFEESTFLKAVVRKKVAKYKQAADRIRSCGQTPSEFNAVRFLRKNEVADFLRWCEMQGK